MGTDKVVLLRKQIIVKLNRRMMLEGQVRNDRTNVIFRTDPKGPIFHLSVCLFAVCTEGNGFLVHVSFNVQDESFEIVWE